MQVTFHQLYSLQIHELWQHLEAKRHILLREAGRADGTLRSSTGLAARGRLGGRRRLGQLLLLLSLVLPVVVQAHQLLPRALSLPQLRFEVVLLRSCLRPVGACHLLDPAFSQLLEAVSQEGQGPAEVAGIDGSRHPELDLVLPHACPDAKVDEPLLGEQIKRAIEDVSARVLFLPDLQPHTQHVLLVREAGDKAAAVVIGALLDLRDQLAELVQVNDRLVGVLVALCLYPVMYLLDPLLMVLNLLGNLVVVLLAPLLDLLLQHHQQLLLILGERLQGLL
mmetsp:Transcript_86713/g.201767  ORF Transcript_86713/g.201767 Transcript_86713/m.201767 type:complete len:280 (+) Transcript_86713:941-1780(+)